LEEEDARIEAVYQFNSNPKRNVGVLCAHFRKEPTPANIAYLLKTTPDLLGSKIGEYLVHPDHLDVLRAYFDQLDLHTSLLEALRLGLGGPFFMPGEAQQVQMTLEVLCDAYIAQNPGLLGSRDDAVLLAYALVILNTDMLRQVGRKMTLPEFISNTTQAMGHTQLSPEALAEMYENLKAKPFEFSPTFNDFMAMCAPKFRGYIEKKSQRAMSFWVKHFFVLTISGLYYFRDDSQECKDKPLGVIQLTEVEVRANDKNRREILLIATGQSLQYVKFRSGRPTPVQNIKKMKLRAENEELRNDWLHRIKKLAIISCFQQGTEETVASDGNETH
jgi:hypothetical protein